MTMHFRTLQALLSALVGGTALLLAVVASLFVYSAQYRQSAKESGEMVQSLVSTVERSAAVAVFAGNVEIATDVVSGLLSNEVVASATLKSNSGILAQRRRAEARAPVSLYRQVIRSPFQGDEPIGVLEIGSNADWVAERARRSALELVAWSFGLICLSALISLQTIRHLLSRHLTRAAQQLDEIEPGSSARVQLPQSLRPTEVGGLISKLNQLLDRIALNLETERRLRAGVEESARELQATQLELMRSEKMAALGSLVEGVAHQLGEPIGNSLSVVGTLAESTQAISKRAHDEIKRPELDAFLADVACGTDFVLRNVQRVSEFLHNFKQVAVEIRSEKPQRFELRNIVGEVLAAHQDSCESAAPAVVGDIAGGIELVSFPEPLKVAVGNLIENAMVHGLAGRQTGSVRVRGWRVDERSVRITVCDDGCGITAANLPRIFEPFFTTRFGTGGSGLGLYVVRNVVENVLGGAVHAESEDGKGTTITLDLPVQIGD